MGESLFGAGVFNLDEALLYRSFPIRCGQYPGACTLWILTYSGQARGPVPVGVTPRYWYLRTSTSCLSLTIGSLESDWTH